MKMKILLSVIIITIVAFTAVHIKGGHNDAENLNMCQDNALVLKFIEQNKNPFSKFKFIKKRNEDCKTLLNDNKDDAVRYKKEEFCSILDSSTNSLTVLINAYVHDMYDRETASRELRSMTPLMTPYDYCPQYIDDMITIISIKKRLGL